MSTRSLITLKENDTLYKSIYCHHDGYPEGVGDTLLEHYNTLEKVRELIALGDMSSLGERPETCDTYKDRGEELNISIFDNLQDCMSQDRWQEYHYIFDAENGKWKHNANTYKIERIESELEDLDFEKVDDNLWRNGNIDIQLIVHNDKL